MRHVTQATYHRKIKIPSDNNQNNEVDKVHYKCPLPTADN